MYCRYCGAYIGGKDRFCPQCGEKTNEDRSQYSPQEESVVQISEEKNQSPIPHQVKTKKKRGCLIPVLVVIAFSLAIFAYIFARETEVVFDASQYTMVNGENISETELIAQLGEPDSVEDWNYDREDGRTFPIHTLHYDNYEYNFYDDNLQRITILDCEFDYKIKNDFILMFGLEDNENTQIKDTGSWYRAYDCGIHDLWIQYEDGKVVFAHISYSGIFG